MSTDTRWKNIKVIIIVALALVFLVSFYLLVLRVDFSDNKSLKVRFDNVGSIQIGSPIRKSGVKVGSVKAMEINPQDQKTVIVTLGLNPGQLVKKGDKVSIVSGGLLGDQYVEILPVDPNASEIDYHQLLEGEKAMDLRSLAQQGQNILGDVNKSAHVLSDFLETNDETLNRIVHNVDVTTANLAEITQEAKKLEVLVPYLNNKVKEIGDRFTLMEIRADKILTQLDTQLTPSLADFRVTLANLKQITGDVKAMTTALNEPDSFISLLKKPETAKSVNQTLENIRVITNNLKVISDELKQSTAK